MRVMLASVVATTLAVTIGSVSAAGQSAKNDVKPVAIVSATSVSAAGQPAKLDDVKFATLRGVKAVPMASRELDAVKGLHIHFVTPGGFHLVNHLENNLGNGQANPGSGPGYSGLCGAALRSPALVIPGQNPVTGVGAGC